MNSAVEDHFLTIFFADRNRGSQNSDFLRGGNRASWMPRAKPQGGVTPKDDSTDRRPCGLKVGCFGESVPFHSLPSLRFSGVFSANLTGAEKKRTLHETPWGRRPFPRTTPSPLTFGALWIKKSASYFWGAVRTIVTHASEYVRFWCTQDLVRCPR